MSVSGIVPRPSTSASGSPWSQHTTTPSGASTMPSIFWSRKWRGRAAASVAGAGVEAVGLAQPLALGQPADLHARGDLADDDQPPRLHQPDRRRPVRGAEDPLQRVGRDLVGAEAADVAALADHPVDGGAGVLGVAPAARIGRALGGAGG